MVFVQLHILLLGALSVSAVRPPLGAVYSRTVRLPVIGKQTVELAIVSSNQARLMLSGRLNLDEPVSYSFSESGELRFELTEATQRLLRRFRTTLDAAGYDGGTDTSWVVVWPPLPLSVRIRLKRIEDTSRRRWGLSIPKRWRSRVGEVVHS